MATTQESIHSRLSSDGTLTAMLTGGIWKRPLKRGGRDAQNRLTPPGCTPEAFEGGTGRLKPAAVVVSDGDDADPLGPVDAAFSGFATVWLYAERTDSGKQTLDTAWEQAFGRLHRWHFGTTNGTDVEAVVIGRMGARDDPEIADAVVGTLRLQLVGLWRNTD